MNGSRMDLVKSMDTTPDIHHIFPADYCKNMKYPREKWNSIVNKTPLLPSSNRAIGGNAPSVYSAKIMRDASIDEAELRKRITSNFIDFDFFIADNFNEYFIDRAKRLLNLIESATGKETADRNSAQTIAQFGRSLE